MTRLRPVPLLLAAVLLIGVFLIARRFVPGLKPRPAAVPALFTQAQALQALTRESDYIADCSYTTKTTNHSQVVANSPAYGAINNVRVASSGADWVAPETGAVAVIALMKASALLRANGKPTARYDIVTDAFFDRWLLTGQAAAAGSAPDDAGGISPRLYYDSMGKRQRGDSATPSATGMTISAMWKRYEYLATTGRKGSGEAWLRRAWPLARPAGAYLLRHYDPHFKMERGPSSSADLWLPDAVGAAVGLRCLDRWAAALGAPDPRYAATADHLTQGIEDMKDPGTWFNFYRVRKSEEQFRPGYGDSIDQLCFLPYEAGILPPTDPYLRRLSDWWTYGGNEVSMTAQIDDPKNWTFYGTRWHFYFSPRPENAYLYPGPGLQLAKVEWKAAQAGDRDLAVRAANRLRWAAGRDYSALWLGATEDTESGVGNGLIDWRDEKNYPHTAEKWTRFVDTSAYFLETVSMVSFGQDTSYVPEHAAHLPK